MKRLQSRTIAGLAAAAMSLAALALEVDLSTPEASVRTLHAGLVEVASAGGSVEDRFEALVPLIRQTHDLEQIARLSVRRQWRDFDETQRQRFAEAFERLSIMTYAARFASVTADTFSFVGAGPGPGGRAEVATQIRTQSETIALDYTLQESEDGWRIINIVADGVSDLALKRAEYQSVLADGDFEDLMGYIAGQTDALAE